MEPVTTDSLLLLAEQLGERLATPFRLYLLGGSAMLLLGSPRATKDVDYDLDPSGLDALEPRQILAELAEELRLDLEFVPLAEFVPLPAGFEDRHRVVGRFRQLELLIFDPYSLALSKIARGFEADLEDVVFLLHRELINMAELRAMFESVLPRAWDADVDPVEFAQYFDELERLIHRDT